MNLREQMSLRIFNEIEQRRLQDLLLQVEQISNINNISNILYSALNELITNATRANMKRAYFKLHGIPFDESEHFFQGLTTFREIYPRIHNHPEYHRKLEEMDLEVSIKINLSPERLLIYVENNSLMTGEEERRIREKLAGAMNVKDLIQFSLKHGDSKEGEGLGLAMVVQLLKYLGFNPGLFRIYTDRQWTVSRLEFPLDDEYLPLRLA